MIDPARVTQAVEVLGRCAQGDLAQRMTALLNSLFVAGFGTKDQCREATLRLAEAVLSIPSQPELPQTSGPGGK